VQGEVMILAKTMILTTNKNLVFFVDGSHCCILGLWSYGFGFDWLYNFIDLNVSELSRENAGA
jgi:hypothetical protein